MTFTDSIIDELFASLDNYHYVHLRQIQVHHKHSKNSGKFWKDRGEFFLKVILSFLNCFPTFCEFSQILEIFFVDPWFQIQHISPKRITWARLYLLLNHP